MTRLESGAQSDGGFFPWSDWLGRGYTMSDVMLHGVLRMPPKLWTGDVFDVAQRHSRYVQASDRIAADEREIGLLRDVYEAARSVLRNNGVDAARVTAALREMDDAIEAVKLLDAGTDDCPNASAQGKTGHD